jgi:methylenetetrahydrofolate dehydrogenase (NADP+) / methenyltetrahydrofolate cyclohydrolase
MPVTSPPEPDTAPERVNGTLIMGGRLPAARIRRSCAQEIEAIRTRFGVVPGLAVVRVGEDPASVRYARKIKQLGREVGLPVELLPLAPTTGRAALQAELARLSVLPEIAGIIVQMPLPPHLALHDVVEVLDPAKDVDGIHPVNIGKLALGLDCFVPATPAGGLSLLEHYGIELEGKAALVIGRSGVVGKPFANLLLSRNATVTIAHSRSRDLKSLAEGADLVAAAVGHAGLVRGEWLRKGSVVIDFGVSIVNGAPRGDVDYDGALGRAQAITPVPGGTGPMTNAMLLKNTVKAIHRTLGTASVGTNEGEKRG